MTSARSSVAIPAFTGTGSKYSFQFSDSQTNLLRPSRASRASSICSGERRLFRR